MEQVKFKSLRWVLKNFSVFFFPKSLPGFLPYFIWCECQNQMLLFL